MVMTYYCIFIKPVLCRQFYVSEQLTAVFLEKGRFFFQAFLGDGELLCQAFYAEILFCAAVDELLCQSRIKAVDSTAAGNTAVDHDALRFFYLTAPENVTVRGDILNEGIVGKYSHVLSGKDILKVETVAAGGG